jgi:hypothetical protein
MDQMMERLVAEKKQPRTPEKRNKNQLKDGR